MCGISGLLTSKTAPPHRVVEKMVEAQVHRGPDHSGMKRIPTGEGECRLGSNRLSILDLSSAGHMPMVDPQTGNTIVYNGEIYNFRELRRELQACGETFHSASDTEVVLKAYGRWGCESVKRFRGMFALAIWDQHRRELFLARDRLGKKPLYTCQDSTGDFLFASELRSLLAGGSVTRRIDPLSLEAFLFNGFVIAPRTMVEGVRSLLPGHWMRVDSKGRIVEVRRYWRLPRDVASSAEPRGSGREILECLKESVRLRIVSDVPLGVFLSGGLDSSTIVALVRQAKGEVKTFSVAFEEATYDESASARWVAKHFETDHTEVRLRREDFWGWLPEALAAMDQPSFDGVNTYCVAKTARASGLTVALSGLGSDEVFGGYPFFNSVPRLLPLAVLADRCPPRSLSLARDWLNRHCRQTAGSWKSLEILYGAGENGGGTAPLAAYQTAQLLFPSWVRSRLLAPSLALRPPAVWLGLPREFLDFMQEEEADETLPERLSRYALRLFLGERCLRDTDTMSMGVSLEVRAPFTDHLLIEALWRIPGTTRCGGAPDKPFEWDLVRSLLGEDYPLRKKQGFIFPFEEWLHNKAIRDAILDPLADRQLTAGIGLQHEAVQEIANRFVCRKGPIPWSRIWSLFVLLHWCQQHRVSL